MLSSRILQSYKTDTHPLRYKVLEGVADKVHWKLLGQRDYYLQWEIWEKFPEGATEIDLNIWVWLVHTENVLYKYQ